MTDFIFVHGAMMGGWVWDETIAAIKEKSGEARCIALDVPGCGSKRGRDVRELSFDGLIHGLLDDVDASGLTDAVLIGHSQGGTVLPRLAEARPGLFRKLVYIACVGPNPGQSVMDASDSDGDGQDVKATTIMEGLRTMLCNDMDVAMTRDFLAKLGGGDAWPPASYIFNGWRYDHLEHVPSAYIYCERDNCVPPARQDAYLANLHIDSVIRLDCGHQPMNSRPEELADILLAEAG
ncbi:MAG: alpha/beta hydrolase [Novosphingobium sp.]|nr:alpha/beta hydrolase [Novosphingobium sp.]